MSKTEIEFRNTFSEPYKQGKRYGLQVVLANIQHRQLEIIKERDVLYEPYIAAIREGEEKKALEYYKMISGYDDTLEALEDIIDGILLEMER